LEVHLGQSTGFSGGGSFGRPFASNSTSFFLLSSSSSSASPGSFRFVVVVVVFMLRFRATFRYRRDKCWKQLTWNISLICLSSVSFSSTRAVLSFHAFLSKLFTRAHSANPTIVKRFLSECVQKESLADALRYQITNEAPGDKFGSLFNYILFFFSTTQRDPHQRKILFFPATNRRGCPGERV
jgi:hypothetical protein